MNQQAAPAGMHPCWYITKEEVARALKAGKSFAEYTNTEDFSRITNRIDSNFIQGNLARRDKQYSLLNDVRLRYSYLIDYFERKKVYFTFDHINLYELLELFPSHPDPILFTLKRRDAHRIIKPNQAFMIMPFKQPELDNIYFSHIKPFFKSELNMEIFRADDFRTNDIIVDTIYRLIRESELIIADTTHANKNAFYELGYASALEKEIIMMQNKTEQKLFFDRAHIRSIFYDLSDIPAFHFELEATILAIKSKNS